MLADKYSSLAYLAFDLGASSSRAILGRLNGTRLEMEELHRFPTPIISEGEQLYWDLETLWLELKTGLQRALNASPRLCSLSVDSWGFDYVPINKEGNPVRNPYCYRSPRTMGMMDKVLQQVSASELYEATGIQFLETNTLSQVLTDLEFESDLERQTANRMMIADYFNYRFSGRAAAEISLASTTSLIDVQSRTWAHPLMQQIGMSTDSWPEIVPTGNCIRFPKNQSRSVSHCWLLSRYRLCRCCRTCCPKEWSLGLFELWYLVIAGSGTDFSDFN